MALVYTVPVSSGGRTTRLAAALLCLTMKTILLGDVLLLVTVAPS